MSDFMLLPGPPLKRVRCPTCAGAGSVRLNPVRLPRKCFSCGGSGIGVSDERFSDITDRRAYELGLAPIEDRP